jgi:hypothetical protein
MLLFIETIGAILLAALIAVLLIELIEPIGRRRNKKKNKHEIKGVRYDCICNVGGDIYLGKRGIFWFNCITVASFMIFFL